MQFDKWRIMALAVMMILLLGCAKAGGKAPGYYLNGETLLVDLSVALKMDMELEDKEKGGLLFTLPENYPTIPANTPFAITRVSGDENNNLRTQWMEHWGMKKVDETTWIGGSTDREREMLPILDEYSRPLVENGSGESGIFPTEEMGNERRRMVTERSACVEWSRVEEVSNANGQDAATQFCYDKGLPAGIYIFSINFPVPIVVK